MRNRLLVATLAALVLTACRIAPVITEPVLSDPVPPQSRYDECKRAAQEYCSHVVEASKDAMPRCIAEAAYDCVSGGR